MVTNNILPGMKSNHATGSHYRSENWIALFLCVAVIVSRILEQSFQNQFDGSSILALVWIPLVVTVFIATGFIRMDEQPVLLRIRQMVYWGCLLLMVWVANGLPFDILRMAGLIPMPVNWPGFVTKVLAFAVVVILIHQTFPVPVKNRHVTRLYGYAAFILALPYPVLRTCWMFGGTLGLNSAGAAGTGFIPWLASIPWWIAAILSLLLVSKRFFLPRRLLLAAGWSATAVVALIGPVACRVLISDLLKGEDTGFGDMAIWVPCLFYFSWLFYAVAIGAATRSFQLRTAQSERVPAAGLVNLNGESEG